MAVPPKVSMEMSELGGPGEPGEQVQDASKELSVLIVEDCPDTAATLAQLLRLWGHLATIAYTGAEALRLAAVQQPDVVLLDIGLPGLDGWEVAQRLREISSDRQPFIIAVSGFGGEADRRHSEDVGCDLHLLKPVEPAALEKLLRLYARNDKRVRVVRPTRP